MGLATAGSAMAAGGSGRPHLTAVVSQREIRAALAHDELVLHYQPVVELATGRPHGVEALLRWQHPRGGLLAPDDFLPALVQTPVMDEVSRWVLATACAEASRWPGWQIAVNITARDLARPRFVADVQAALSRAGLTADRLLLELTEQALVQDLTAAVAALTQLRTLGVGLALDDFGTGYSSMLYLRELPVTELKIDRLFVSGLGRHRDDTAIVASVISLARAVGLAAVAEGVETDYQRSRLIAQGCRFGQGYLFARPAPAEDIDPGADYGSAGPQPQPPPRRRPGATPAVQQRMADLLDDGASLHTIAAALNREGLRTPAGSRWQASTVAQALSAGEPPASGRR